MITCFQCPFPSCNFSKLSVNWPHQFPVLARITEQEGWWDAVCVSQLGRPTEYPNTEKYISVLMINEDSAHKNKAFPVYVTTSLVLPRKEKIIFSVIRFLHITHICTDKQFYRVVLFVCYTCLCLNNLQGTVQTPKYFTVMFSLITDEKKWDELFEVKQELNYATFT